MPELPAAQPPSPLDARSGETIRRFVRRFQQIEVRLTSGAPAHVHAPYMLLSTSLLDNPLVFERMKERNRARLERVRAARAAAGPELQALFERHFWDTEGREVNLARGRAEMDAIQALLQEALDLGLIPGQQGGQPDGIDLRAWLKTYGIGLDCSGFVQQTLQHLRSACMEGCGPEIPLLRCPWVYRALSASGPRPSQFFTPIGLPCEAHPGDILVNPAHMRILMRLEAGSDGLIFHLAESTSASDIPNGHTREETDIGPRVIQVKYAQPARPISAQAPLWKRETQDTFQPSENESTYIIARYW